MKPEFARLARDPRVMRYIGDGTPWPDDHINEVFNRLSREWADHGFGWHVASWRETGEFVGFIGLNHVGPEAVEIEDKEAVEIGWWIDPAHWGVGLATEGAEAVRDDAFVGKGLHRLIARHQAANPGSGRVMEKIGMVFEREAIGRHGDLVRIYSLERTHRFEITRARGGLRSADRDALL